ncbi:MAG: peptidoglycan DD-metalloendopeptidase family protein [Buchnera aphidicola (Floraphis choui)]
MSCINKNIFLFISKKNFLYLVGFLVIIMSDIIFINCNTINNNNKFELKGSHSNNFLKKNKILNKIKLNFIPKISCYSEKYYPLNASKNCIYLKFFNDYLATNLVLNSSYISNNIKNKNLSLKRSLIYNTQEHFNKNILNHKQKHCEYLSVKGILNNNFSHTIKNLGLDSYEITNIINIVKHQINFYKLNINNPFSILIKKNILKEKIYKNKIIGLKIYHNNLNHYGVLANNGKFYDNQGYSLIEKFLKFPALKKYRISSNFNPHRFNPITKKISPHQGIDLAMPIGTPILSIGNGEIIKTKSSLGAGKYITIKHNVQYVTRYMHLKKILVKVGDKVKRGDKIGLSGNTGYSTGPHLHYEIWSKNKVINPEKLIISERLSGNNLKVYLKYWKSIMYYLKNI